MTTTATRPPPTLLALIDQIRADPALAAARRRDLVSSLRSFARGTNRELGALPAEAEALRGLIRRAHPASTGLSPKRWANIRSDLAFALRRYAGPAPRRWQASRLTGPWAELRARIPDFWGQVRLSRLFRFLAEQDIAPGDVTPQTFAAFAGWLRNGTLARNPEPLLRRIHRYWNRAVATVPGWPPVMAPETGRTDLYVLPLEAFPASFAAELAAWQAAMRGDDLLADNGPGRPLLPATVQHQTRILRRFASALAHQGVAPAAITGLADLVRPEHVKRGLRFFLDRHGGTPSPGTTGMADVLLTLARRWLRAEEAQLRELQAIAKRILCRQAGLTASNRARLIQFDDPRNIRRLLDLPRQLVERSGGLPAVAAARLVQSALAIAILLAAPLRLRNLAQLNLHRHVIRTGRGARASVRLVIEREETKNREVLDYPLPVETVQLLDRYLRHHRRHLLVGADQGWLFPGLAGRAREQGGLAKQIQKAVRVHTGLVMHVHLFRHLAGKLSLLVDADNYEQVRRLLGHRSITTTTTFYTGFATDAAARRYHQQVLQHPGPAASQAAARPRREPRPAVDAPEPGPRSGGARPGRRRG